MMQVSFQDKSVFKTNILKPLALEIISPLQRQESDEESFYFLNQKKNKEEWFGEDKEKLLLIQDPQEKDYSFSGSNLSFIF